MDNSMDNSMDKDMKKYLDGILMVSISPIAILILIFMALFSLLQFLYKATLLFIIVAINTPFAMLYNVSVLIFKFNLRRLISKYKLDGLIRKYNLGCLLGPQDPSLKTKSLEEGEATPSKAAPRKEMPFQSSQSKDWNYYDPRASLGIEIQLIVSDFFKVVAGELLLVISTGVITFYTSPRPVFYISLAVGMTAILLKWLNTNSLSKTALSCLCGGYGLSPMMFLFSFIGLFDIGCHPVAKCSFRASKAFIFHKDDTNLEGSDHEQGGNEMNESEDVRWFPFKSKPMPKKKEVFVEFPHWDAFEKGLFQLIPRIYFIETPGGKSILKSFMMLRFLDCDICNYPVERLELPEDYSKFNQLYNFLDTLSSQDGFVTNKIRGRYEQSLTLLEIVDGVEEKDGYSTLDPIDACFVVATCTNKPQ